MARSLLSSVKNRASCSWIHEVASSIGIFAGIHGEVDALENFAIADFGVQIFDFE